MEVNIIITQLMQMTGSSTKSQLANRLGITPQTICNWERRGSIPYVGATAIKSKLEDVNLLWLTGQSEQMMEQTIEEQKSAQETTQSPVAPSPVEPQSTPARAEQPRMYMAQEVHDIAAMCGTVDVLSESEWLSPVQVPWPGIRYVLTCRGDSMMPRVCDGDKVYVGDPLSRYARLTDGVLYLVVTRTQVMVKYVVDPGSNKPYLQLRCENPDYVMEDGGRLMKDEVRQIYKVKVVVNFQD